MIKVNRKDRAQLGDIHREHAQAYLDGVYPKWRLNLQEWAWVRRLRKVQDKEQES